MKAFFFISFFIWFSTSNNINSSNLLENKAYSNQSALLNIVVGRVTDGCDGNPIAGASVTIKNTPIGTITDFEGNYSISPVNTGDVLVFSAVGYYTKEVPVNVSFDGCPPNTPCTRILYVDLECITI